MVTVMCETEAVITKNTEHQDTVNQNAKTGKGILFFSLKRTNREMLLTDGGKRSIDSVSIYVCERERGEDFFTSVFLCV